MVLGAYGDRLNLGRKVLGSSAGPATIFPWAFGLIASPPGAVHAPFGAVRRWRVGKRSENWMDWLVQPLWKPAWQFLEKVNTELPYDPDIACKQMPTQKHVHRCS